MLISVVELPSLKRVSCMYLKLFVRNTTSEFELAAYTVHCADSFNLGSVIGEERTFWYGHCLPVSVRVLDVYPSSILDGVRH